MEYRNLHVHIIDMMLRPYVFLLEIHSFLKEICSSTKKYCVRTVALVRTCWLTMAHARDARTRPRADPSSVAFGGTTQLHTATVFHSDHANIGSGRPYHRPLGGVDARGGVPGAADQPE